MSNILKMEMITIYFNRKSIRLKYFDYSKNGMYYVTICTKNRECILSQIQNLIVGADDSVRPYKRLYKDLNRLQPDNVLNLDIELFGNEIIMNILLEMKKNIFKYVNI